MAVEAEPNLVPGRLGMDLRRAVLDSLHEEQVDVPEYLVRLACVAIDVGLFATY